MTKTVKNKNKYEVCENAKPFFLKTKNKNCLVIFIHAFTDSAGNIRSIAEDLQKMGINSYATCLPGHGTHYKDLESYTPNDFLKHLIKDFKKVADGYKNIYLVGFSLGGNLALDLSIKYPERIKGVVCVGSPVWITGHNVIKTFAPIVLPVYRYKKRNYPSEAIRKKFLENGSYEHFPLKAVIALIKYIENMRERLKKITVPVAFVNPANKRHTDLKSAQFLYDHVSSKRKKIVNVYDYYHLSSQRKILREVVEFFNLSKYDKTKNNK